METHHMRNASLLFSMLWLAALFALNGPVHGATSASGDSEQILLAKGAFSRIDAPRPHTPTHKLMDNNASDEMVLAKGRAGRVDDLPKPHPPHKLMENSASNEMVLAKGNRAPAGAPRLDAPIRKAPHAPGAVHG